MNQTEATQEIAELLSEPGVFQRVGILSPLEDHNPPAIICNLRGTFLSVTVEILSS